MDTRELLNKVRKIEIKTKGITNQVFVGSYQSAFKGRGMAFSEVRGYQYGDDIRTIDWNVTARFSQPYVKIFEEERELTVILLIDVSGSNTFGTSLKPKEQMIAEIAAVLAFSAIKNNDKVGVIFFSNKIEKFIPPKKGTSHILRIIRELIDFKPTHQGTDISFALRYLRNVIKKKSTAFLISDFQDKGFEDALTICAKKHDIVCLRVFDPIEFQIPGCGLVKIHDAETGKNIWLDTSGKSTKQGLKKWHDEHEAFLKQVFAKASVDYTNIPTTKDYVPLLTTLFKKRAH